MSDFARLKEKLGKLRQTEPRSGGVRVLSGHDANGRLHAAITEIDETILPRRVTFEGPDAQASIGVANRQLTLIFGGPGPDADETHVVTGRDDPALATLRDRLLAMFAHDGPWTLRSEKLDRGDTARMRPDAGAGAGVLVGMWGLEPSGDDPGQDAGDAPRRFIDRVKSRCDAWLLIEGEEIAASGGSETGINWLSERAGGFLDGYYAKREMFSNGEPLAFAFSGGTGASLIYFESGDQAGFATLPPGEVGAALGDWASSTG